MKLREYVQSLPRGGRKRFRELLADKHGCSVSLVRKWEAWPPPGDWGPDQCKAMARRHPSDLTSIKITEALTGNSVTRRDLRPEVWGDEEK